MNEFNKYVGSVIRDLRENRKMSQHDVARVLNRDNSLISYWESGRRQMNVIDLMNYLDALKVTDEEREQIVYSLVKYKTKG